MASKPHMPDPYLVDDINYELTDEEIKTLRPAREFFEEHGLPFPETHARRDGEIQYVVNFDPRVVDHFKAKGGDWQDRLNEALLEMIAAGDKKKAS